MPLLVLDALALLDVAPPAPPAPPVPPALLVVAPPWPPAPPPLDEDDAVVLPVLLDVSEVELSPPLLPVVDVAHPVAAERPVAPASRASAPERRASAGKQSLFMVVSKRGGSSGGSSAIRRIVGILTRTRQIDPRARALRPCEAPERMRPALAAILTELLTRHRASGRVHLNDIDEVIDRTPVSYDEVDALIAALEAEGLAVGEPPDDAAIAVMREVMASARRLREASGRAPSVEEIAAASGHAAHVVRRALESARSAAPRAPLAGLIPLPRAHEPE